MDVLILLVERRRQLVSRADIVERLWGKDVFVDVETGVHTAIRKIRQALGDSIEHPAFVETVPGKGYRFVADVEVVSGAPDARASRPLEPADPSVPDVGVGHEARGELADSGRASRHRRSTNRSASCDWRGRRRDGDRLSSPGRGSAAARQPHGSHSPCCPSSTSGAIPSATTWPQASPRRPARRSHRSISSA